MSDLLVEWLRPLIEAEKALAERVAARYVAGPDSEHPGQAYWPTHVVERQWSRYEDADIAAGLDLVKMHNPRAVIARCEADLAILDEHQRFGVDEECVRCVSWGTDVEGELCAAPHGYPCRTVRLLAWSYRHRDPDGYAKVAGDWTS